MFYNRCMHISQNVDLSDFTSFKTGGKSEVFAVAKNSDELIEVITTQPKPFWLLGTGANSLISDKGLPGTTIQIQLQAMEFKDDHTVEVESGVVWDELVIKAIEMKLWGLELTSGIPSSVGAAVVGNIAAYGQAVSDSLLWVDVIDTSQPTPAPKRLMASDLEFDYRTSVFSKNYNNSIIILKCCFQLSPTQTKELSYESALKIAATENLDIHTLDGCRQTIMLAREAAGSLLDAKHAQRTAGSFFKNPVVTEEQAEFIMSFEERPVTKEQIMNQNRTHGGSSLRVSASHVLLAAGFERGQAWGPVRLHPDHILKIENIGGATSQQIYDVAQEIIHTVKTKLDVDLVPEVRFLGDFS